MAMQTFDMPVIATGYVREDQPNTVFPTSAAGTYEVNGKESNFSRKRLYFQADPDDFPTALRHQKLFGLQLCLCWYLPSTPKLYVAASDIDPETLTFNTAPNGVAVGIGIVSGSNIWTDGFAPYTVEASGINEYGSETSYFYKSGCCGYVTYETTDASTLVKSVLKNGGQPFFRIYYNDSVRNTSFLSITSGPTSGYRDPGEAITITWSLRSTASYYSAASTFNQQSATLFWKTTESETWNRVDLAGSASEYTVPAGTFPRASNIQWYMQAEDDMGDTPSTITYSFTTADSDTTATPTAPVSTIEDGSLPITFRWSYSNDNGTTPTRIIVEYSHSSDAPSVGWRTIVDSADPITEYTVPASYFAAGTITWRTTAYNADGIAGPVTTASFICIVSPGPPNIVSVDQVPFATVTWQASGQQAYRIELDGVDQGTFFGTGNSFTFDEPLSNGLHTFTLYVQGQYSLWSEGMETLINIQNQPGDAVDLSAVLDADALLSWTSADATADFLIYRDGVRIGHTEAYDFRDWMVLGDHYWYVLNRLPDGNYTKSNTVGGTLDVTVPIIATLPEPEWLELRLTDQSLSAETFTYSRTYSLRHVTGTKYPVLELAPYEDLIANYMVAFRNASDARAIEAMKGSPVILKSRGYNVMIGALVNVQKVVNGFYLTYQITLQRIHWEDYRDDGQNN